MWGSFGKAVLRGGLSAFFQCRWAPPRRVARIVGARRQCCSPGASASFFKLKRGEINVLHVVHGERRHHGFQEDAMEPAF